ncbi:MAG: hypothetical protein H0T45_17275 [Pyrinomonadaceae bacterium]|nr:hypothetical protein [Pyrinomonadaceae bacterium]
MTAHRIITVTVSLTFFCGAVSPEVAAGTARWADGVVAAASGITAAASATPTMQRHGRRRSGYGRRRGGRLKRVVTAPYRGAKGLGKFVGRGVRRLFTGRSRKRQRDY